MPLYQINNYFLFSKSIKCILVYRNTYRKLNIQLKLCSIKLENKKFEPHSIFMIENKIFQKKKYHELLKSIQNKEFPILVCGHSGAGKTFNILHALETLNLKYRFAELDGKIIKKPILKNIITLVYLYDQKDLGNIKFKDNLIVETSIPWATKFENFKIIKFSKPESKQAIKTRRSPNTNSLFLQNYDGSNLESVDLFRFLGRVFYKKVSVSDIQIKNGMLIYFNSNVNNTIPEDISINKSKTFYMNENIEKHQSRRFILDLDESESNSQKNILKPQYENDLDVSFDDDFIFNTLDTQISIDKNEKSIDKVIYKLKKYLTTEEILKQTHHSKSFNLRIFQKFIYENFLYFVNFKELSNIYECISLSDLDEKLILAFLQCLIQTEPKKDNFFYSFKYPKFEENKCKNTNWRYSLRMNNG